MLRPPALLLVLGLILSLILAGCGRRASDDVRVRIEGVALLLENRTRDDVLYVIIGPGFEQAWVPSTVPRNRIESGRFKRWRISPGDWGSTVQVYWWHPADDAAASGMPPADRLRKLTLTLDEPNPLPSDEQLVRACVVVKRAEGAMPRNFDAEAFCMKEAEDCLARGGVECAVHASGWQKAQRELNAKP